MKKPLTLEKGIRIVAGSFVVISVLLGLLVNKWWFAFTIFVGAEFNPIGNYRLLSGREDFTKIRLKERKRPSIIKSV